MNDLQVFGFEGRNVRVVEKDGNPWWVLRDVCDVLGIGNAGDVSARLDDDEKGIEQIDTLGGKQAATIITESGLYAAILRSDKPDAKRFRKWITSEVLPAIRKTGSYGIPKITRTPPVSLVTSVNRSVTLKIITPDEAKAIILLACREKKQAFGQLIGNDSIPEIRPLVAFFDRPEFGGISAVLESLEKNPRALERSGVARRVHKGVPELLIEHEHKVLTKIVGKGYKITLRKDSAYIGTVQAHIARNQVSCLVFDWDGLPNERFSTILLDRVLRT